MDSTGALPDDASARLARWAERDATVGLEAELRQARTDLAAREQSIVDLRARVEQLANRVTQLELERTGLQHQVVALQRVPFARRAYGKARRVAGRVLR
ncbi:MAG: hypothetical protein U0Q03_21400 [Acidimicrobiales bacterium]